MRVLARPRKRSGAAAPSSSTNLPGSSHYRILCICFASAWSCSLQHYWSLLCPPPHPSALSSNITFSRKLSLISQDQVSLITTSYVFSPMPLILIDICTFMLSYGLLPERPGICHTTFPPGKHTPPRLLIVILQGPSWISLPISLPSWKYFCPSSLVYYKYDFCTSSVAL